MGKRQYVEDELSKLDKKVAGLKKLVSEIQKISPDIVAEAKERIKNSERKKKLKKGVCERCGGKDAIWQPNPYILELEDRSVYEWQCHDCADKLMDDI